MTPIARFQALQAELNPIQDKKSHDNKWFEVGHDGKLLLCKRHYWGRNENFSGRCLEEIWNCFCRIVQSIRRLFCNPYSILEKKIHDLTGKINEYLTLEDDPKRRSEFLDQYGPAVNMLFQAASKLEKINRLKAPAIDPKMPIREWMLGDTSKTDVFFSTKNENPKYPVRFIMNVYEWALSAKDKVIQKRFDKQFGKDWAIRAQFEQKGEKVLDLQKAFKIVIQPDGAMTYKQIGEASVADYMTVIIENKSHFDLSLQLNGYTNEANTLSLNSRQVNDYDLSASETRIIYLPTTIPKDERAGAAFRRSMTEAAIAKDKTLAASPLPPKADGILHRLAFDIHGTQEKQMRFGCKAGQYRAIMREDGKLDVDIKAFRVIQGLSQENRLVKSTQTLAITYSHPGDVSTFAFFNEFHIANGPNLQIVNQSKNLLDVDVSVKPSGNGNQPFTPSFDISELMIPAQQKKSWGFLSFEELAKERWIKEAAVKIEQQGEAEFSISIRELATE